MQRIGIIMRRDYREMRRTAALRIMLGIITLVTLAAAAGISVAFQRQPWLGQPEARPLLELGIGLVLYFLPLAVLLAFIWAFASLPLTKEKVNGNVEALMATPLKPRELWLGKSLAIFVPAYLISLIATVAVVLIINLTVILPTTGDFVLPPSSLVLGLIVDPLFFGGLLLFMILFALADNPDVALAPSFIIGFGLMMGVPVGLGLGKLNLTSWSFTLWYLAATAVSWLIVAWLTRLLRKEKIVLSSRGS